MASTSSHYASSSVSYLTPPSDSQTLRLPWDVFLSFRGPDTRTKFVCHLYDKLDGYKIRTFRDNPELRTGEVISESLIEAIQDSKIYVVVFSENYASSSWCLDELVEIYKCHENMSRLVVGVYYNIDPSVVRHQTKSFEKAFEKHQTRFADKVDKWRRTLTKVAGLSGQPVTAQRDESDIINEVVDVILREVKPKTLSVAKYPVGLDSRLEYITGFMPSSGTEGVTKIGLHGMGGVGKTTLAKTLYNQFLLRRFEGSCFLAGVREAWGITNGLVPLQQQLIDEVLRSKKNVVVHNVSEGTIIIRERLCSAKVLVLLDDIDNLEQYDSLIGPFAPGSIVIITTRYEDLLIKIKVKREYRYHVKELDNAESRALFTKHAFPDAEPDNTLMAFFDDILLLSGRLPLALEVFGSHLSTKSEVGMWKAYINKLKQNVPISIQQKLRISLDALEQDDRILKKIFLDIACFFIGRKKEEVVQIMETYYSDVHYDFDTLQKRSLLTINNEEELGMHDLLRDMGRQVIKDDSHEDIGRYSRLWVLKDICFVLRKPKGSKEIEAIVPSNFYYHDVLEEETFETKTFRRMSRLRFLYLKNVKLIGSFKGIFEKLRWFCWECCPLMCLPSDFCAEELVILALRGSNMRTMWERNRVTAVFGNLTTLDMSYSLDLIMTPDFSKFPNLQTLNLKGCKSLEEVHISIGSLARLVSLNMGDCVSLKTLPDSICNLKALNSFIINGCSTLIGSLTEVNAWGLTVWKLPILIGHLSKLVELNPKDAASHQTPTRWDVFLCFRGISTREGFSNRLHKALCRRFISIYMDNPDVRGKGEAISHILPKAIEESKTYVVLFSEDYAFSERCLDELVEILNCHKTMQKSVIPVYYKIDPSDVRHQTGSFKEAFEKHQIRYASEMEKVDKWRLSLSEVANFSGYHISQDRDESNIVNGIFDLILYEINIVNGIFDLILYEIKPKTLDVAKYPVGLDSRVKGLTRLLSSSTEGVIKIGISGMGGVGKSTLARALYNQLLLGGSFKGSCFLANVGTISSRTSGVLSLQQQLVNDVLGIKKTFTFHNIEEGTRFIKRRFYSAKLLVVIDDIFCFSDYETLVGPFAFGSVVILTTRDEGLLHEIGVELKYRLNSLDYADSLALFSHYAFGNDKPNHTLMALCKEGILHHAGGHPFALEILGSYLSTKSEVGWISCMEKLQQNPNSTIVQKLLIILDDLEWDDPMLKNMFLDIACFFNGWKTEDVVRIMETYYFHVDHMIDILKKRCLLTINNRDELEMHELLQDIGKEAASNHSYGEPGKYSRLWHWKHISYVLEEHRGTEAIEVIMTQYRFYREYSLEGVSFDAETFTRMSELRFLYLKNVNLTGSFKHSFNNLRFICWEGCPLKCLPSEFHPPKLVFLQLPRSKMTTLWEQNRATEVFDKLTTLDMSYSLNLTTAPDFSKFPCLKTLILEGCENLEEAHISTGSLPRLVSLNLKYCCKVKSLSDLKQLEFLDVTHCNGLTEIQGLEELTSIRKLHLGGCKSSLLAYILTSRFFQIYSGFGHEIKIYIQTAEFPDWIGQSIDFGSTVSINLPPNVSHNFLAVILCFKLWGVVTYGKTTYAVKNTTSGFIWSGSLDNSYPEAQIIIVPRSIFSLEDGDERIELTADAEILRIHLLYRTEITMIDQPDNPIVNVVEDKWWNPSNWLKRKKITIIDEHDNITVGRNKKLK